MAQDKAYIQHEGKVIETGGMYTHVMAIALDPTANYLKGITRCIVSREGDVTTSGYVDRSEIHHIQGESPERFTLGEKLEIEGAREVISALEGPGRDFIGFEDPDIFVDPVSHLIHIYFTMPFLVKEKKNCLVHLGHAVGADLHSLRMTAPVLLADPKTFEGAKELSVAPVNSRGLRLNLVESSHKESDFTYSTVRVATATDMNGPWEYGATVFHPKEKGIPWIGGHASPGPLLPRSFIDIGPDKLVGIMNGREANVRVGTEIKYGMFSVGLFIYDYERGSIDWVSPEPFIIDSEATTITFASQFIETDSGQGILYAHVDDSFVRAYTLSAAEIRKMLPI